MAALAATFFDLRLVGSLRWMTSCGAGIAGPSLLCEWTTVARAISEVNEASVDSPDVANGRRFWTLILLLCDLPLPRVLR